MVKSDHGPYIPRDTSRGIVVQKNKILLMERWRPGLHYFSIPGGGIEAGETPEQTAAREIMEETSISVKVERLVLVMQSDIKHYVYLCKYLSGEPKLAPDAPEALHSSSDNLYKPGWVPIADLPNVLFTYWKPLEKYLIDGLSNGFAEEVVTVTNTA